MTFPMVPAALLLIISFYLFRSPFLLHSHTVGVCAVSNLITRNEKDIYENPDQENR